MDTPSAVVRRFWESVWTQGNSAELVDLLDPEMVENAEPVDVGEFRAAVDSLRRIFPDLRVDIEELIPVGDDRVVSRITYRATQERPWAGIPATGKSFVTPGIDIFTVRNGKIVELWHSADHYDMAVQLGGRLAPAEA